MKFVYVDETGDKGQTDVLVMTGLLIDAYLLRKHTASFDRMLTTFLAKHPGTPKELKTKVFINGSGGWSRLATRRGSPISLLGSAAIVAGPSRPTNCIFERARALELRHRSMCP